MSLSPNSALVQRTIDVHYANRKRSSSLKWIVVNAFFLVIFVYDLWCKCPGYTSSMHYAELLVAAALGYSVLHHGRCLLPSRAAPLPLNRAQLRLLGLAAPDLDSSFVLLESIAKDANSDVSAATDADLSLSLSRAWRSSPSASTAPPSPPSPCASPPAPARDRFIADRRSLADYLKHYEEQVTAEPGAPGNPAAWAAAAAHTPPTYQLAALDTENSKLDESSPQGSPLVWWRLHLDPQRLTQWNFNLRLWIHVTILERLVRELRAAGLVGATPGAESARTPPPALLPYLEPFADKRYLVQRITELASGGCLSNYRWNSGGSDWDDSKPTDAEIVLHLLATYLDGQMPAGGSVGTARAFSSTHLSAAPATPPRGPRALALHRVTQRPPHYVLVMGDETIEVARGRNNLLHSLLLLLAAAARRRPPALARTHLGPAGLNMLWIIGQTH